VAGDFYDFIPGHAGHLGLVIADVSDKGMPAALFMALSRSIIRASVGHTQSLAHGITRANQLICADATGGMFVTLFCAHLFPGSGDVTYVNAGHNPPLLYRRKVTSKGPLRSLTRTGMALGVLADVPLQQCTVRLEPGEFLLLYTDGVVDALNSQGQPFGMACLQQVILTHSDASATDIVNALENAIHDFAGSAAQFDDIAIVIAKRL
jgi:sigma-B regulation protein RsbU (phosphoserine phosphatase)